MIEIHTTETFDRLFKLLPAPIQKKADQRTRLFSENPYHPGLHTEKLHPKHLNAWSFRIDIHYRIVFEFKGPATVFFKYVGHHNSIYRVV